MSNICDFANFVILLKMSLKHFLKQDQKKPILLWYETHTKGLNYGKRCTLGLQYEFHTIKEWIFSDLASKSALNSFLEVSQNKQNQKYYSYSPITFTDPSLIL